jgi:hypothetical protein
MLLGLREFSLLLIEPREAHVGGVNLRVWLGILQRLLQLIAKNEFGFPIFLLLLLHLRQAKANIIQMPGSRGCPRFRHRVQIMLLGSRKISRVSRIPGLPSERLETLRLRRLKSWIECKP